MRKLILDEACKAVVTAMEKRKERAAALQSQTLAIIASTRTDALYLVDHSPLSMSKIAQLANVSRATLDKWRAQRWVSE